MKKLKPNQIAAIGTAFVLPILIWALIAPYTTESKEEYVKCLVLAAAGGAVLGLLAIQKTVQGKVHMAGVIAAVILAVILPLMVSWRSPPTPTGPTSTLLPSAARLTPDEREALRNDLLAIPLTDYEWVVSPQEVNLTFNRSNTDGMYVLNLSFMEQLNNRITFGNTDISTVLFRGTKGEEWNYVRTSATNSIPAGAHTLHIRPSDNFSAHGSDKLVGLFFQLQPPSDGSTVLRTETVIEHDEARPWGPVRTEWQGRPLEWEMTVIFHDSDQNPIEPSQLLKTPILVGWVNVQNEPVSDRNAILATTPVVMLTNTSPGVDDCMILKIYVPADFPSDVFTRVNLRIK